MNVNFKIKIKEGGAFSPWLKVGVYAPNLDDIATLIINIVYLIIYPSRLGGRTTCRFHRSD
ncbi:hypothetical protein CCP3SC5AM1_600013 [Gammaproteobacteria bacterium]